MKQLTIAVGPQGSGNHLYAKLFGSNKNIYGWQSLQEKYWEGHDMEPFSDYWQNPEFLLDFDLHMIISIQVWGVLMYLMEKH